MSKTINVHPAAKSSRYSAELLIAPLSNKMCTSQTKMSITAPTLPLNWHLQKDTSKWFRFLTMHATNRQKWTFTVVQILEVNILNRSPSRTQRNTYRFFNSATLTQRINYWASTVHQTCKKRRIYLALTSCKFCKQARYITTHINFAFSKRESASLQTQQLSILNVSNPPLTVSPDPRYFCAAAQWWGDELKLCANIQHVSLSHAVPHQHTHRYCISDVDAFLYSRVEEVQQQPLPWNCLIPFADQLPLNSNLLVSLPVNHVHGRKSFALKDTWEPWERTTTLFFSSSYSR